MLDNSKPKIEQNNSSRNNAQTQTRTELILSYYKNNLKILVYPYMVILYYTHYYYLLNIYYVVSSL